MRTLRTLIVSLAIVGTAVAQPTTASQTISISIQTPTRLSAASSRLAMELRSEGSVVVGRADDRIAIRGRAGRRISASLREDLPLRSQLTVTIDERAQGAIGSVSLSEANRPVDLPTVAPSGATTEHAVEYRWTSEAALASHASMTPTIVYTLTD